MSWESCCWKDSSGQPARRWTLPTLRKLDFSVSNLVGERQTPSVTKLCRKKDYLMPKKGRDIDISITPGPKVRNPGRAGDSVTRAMKTTPNENEISPSRMTSCCFLSCNTTPRHLPVLSFLVAQKRLRRDTNFNSLGSRP